MVCFCFCQHENTRQCAVYGLGQVAIHAPACLAPVLPDVITAVVAMIRGEGARDGDNNNATENAISTLGEEALDLCFLFQVFY